MSTETSQLSRDQLVEQVESLEKKNHALNCRVEALSGQFKELKRLLLGNKELGQTDVEARESVITSLDRHETDIEQSYEMAKGSQIAIQEMDERVNSSGSAQDKIRAVIRDRLVKRALRGDHDGEVLGIRLADFDEKTPPEVDVAYQQAKRVTTDLAERWPAFISAQNKNGEKMLRVSTPAIDQDLANRCERSLGRDDLANIVVSGNRRGGR